MKINRDALRIIRQRSGLTVPQLARAMEPPCSHATIYDIENGNKNARPEFILRLARALKCPVTALLQDVTDEELLEELLRLADLVASRSKMAA